MSKDRCGNCKFYDYENERIRGVGSDKDPLLSDFESLCLRYPPKHSGEEVANQAEGSLPSRECFTSPTVAAIGWCGEWRMVSNINERFSPVDLVDLIPGESAKEVRIKKVLFNFGTSTVSQLLELTPKDVLKLPGIGVTKLKIIEDRLDLYGLKLRA